MAEMRWQGAMGVLQQGRFREALSFLDASLEAWPEGRTASRDKFSPKVFCARSTCFESLGNVGKALEEIKAALQLAQDDASVHARAAQLYALRDQERKGAEADAGGEGEGTATLAAADDELSTARGALRHAVVGLSLGCSTIEEMKELMDIVESYSRTVGRHRAQQVWAQHVGPRCAARRRSPPSPPSPPPAAPAPAPAAARTSRAHRRAARNERPSPCRDAQLLDCCMAPLAAEPGSCCAELAAAGQWLRAPPWARWPDTPAALQPRGPSAGLGRRELHRVVRRPVKDLFAPRSVRRALLTSQVNPGSLYRCRRST